MAEPSAPKSYAPTAARLGAALAALLATAGLFAGPALASPTSNLPDEAGLTVQVCPAVRPLSYTLGDGTTFTTLALPRVAVVNGADGVVGVSEVKVELLRGGRVMATRELDGAAVLRVAGQKSGAVCDAPGGRAAQLGSTAELRRDEAVVLSGQVFGWTGERDALRIIVQSRRDAEDHRVATVIRLASPITAPAA